MESSLACGNPDVLELIFCKCLYIVVFQSVFFIAVGRHDLGLTRLDAVQSEAVGAHPEGSVATAHHAGEHVVVEPVSRGVRQGGAVLGMAIHQAIASGSEPQTSLRVFVHAEDIAHVVHIEEVEVGGIVAGSAAEGTNPEQLGVVHVEGTQLVGRQSAHATFLDVCHYLVLFGVEQEQASSVGAHPHLAVGGGSHSGDEFVVDVCCSFPCRGEFSQ